MDIDDKISAAMLATPDNDSDHIIINCIVCLFRLQTCLWLCYSPSVLNRKGVKKWKCIVLNAELNNESPIFRKS